MKTITVQVQEDHIETLSRSRPLAAMAELIWNALDADAKEVRVEFHENELEGLDRILVVDDGHGLHYDDAFIVFQNLGGSWKRQGPKTPAERRILHGKFGKGRFRAFSLGNRVQWDTAYEEAGARHAFSILGKAETPGVFSITPLRLVADAACGMRVQIEDVPQNAGVLRGVKAQQEITDTFALYLRQYPGVRLLYDGAHIDAANAEKACSDYTLETLVMENGERVDVSLTIIEWNLPGKRGVYYCDEDGFMLHCGLPRLHFRGFSYTAYLKSAHFTLLDREGLLQAGELSADLRQILDATRAKLREHFTLREAEFAQGVLEEWKEQGIYPYEGQAFSDAEINERRIFDIYATHLNQIFGDFAAAAPRNKRLTLRLIQELVRSEPTRVARILDELITFPEEKEEQILELAQG